MKVHCAIDVAFAIPGDITASTGGYAYARHLLASLPQFGIQPHRLELAAAYPYPEEEDLVATERTFAQLHPETVLMVDGLAFGAMPPAIVNGIRQPLIALVHHPLACETGLTTSQSRQFLALEQQALAHARRVIAASRTTARLLERKYDVPADRVVVAEPGTEPAARAAGGDGDLQLLAVGAIIPRKNYGTLVEALKSLPDDRWHLTIAGSTSRDMTCATELREAIMRSGLRSRITLTGEVSDHVLHDLYDRSDIFVMPSLFEGYGMVLCEALARGLPIVCTTGGAMPETVPDRAALMVAPGKADEMGNALARLIQDDLLRRRLADASWQAGQALPTWDDCARTVAGVITSMSEIR
ncbi:MAG: glycosyltransferase family 4 protein [Hyphomicrobiaceae bacterium]